jgi:hypothetical protein
MEPIPFKEDEYYEYVLAGVLVHTGSADRGHYYSFVRERFLEDTENATTAEAPVTAGTKLNPRYCLFCSDP